MQGPLEWSGGTKKLACVVSRLWVVCSDENRISLFVLCHCLKQKLGCRICWHLLDSCRVPFVRKSEGEKGGEMGDTHHKRSARESLEAPVGVC